MLTFHPLTFDDKPLIDARAAAEDSRSADYNFATQFLWNDEYPRCVADDPTGLTLLCLEGGVPYFLWPFATDTAAAVAAAREYAAAQGFPLTFISLEERHRAELEALFPGEFVFEEQRDMEDYIYAADKLLTLSGKHLHGKRNHINRFTQEHDWRFEPLTKELFPDCLRLLDGWTEHTDTDVGAVDGERRAITKAFDHYEVLGLMGSALFAEDQLVGFSMGSKISSDTFQVRFEKARSDMNGAYPMVNREFVRLFLERYPEIRYVNREEDMGLEGLRQSKESYYPEFLVRKFSARKKEA